ncbi:MAG: HPr family phosphocarrier protein [Ruminococcaceae bacterium]|nr:HPr family phosphocarrier protein [Oscillospiraceae bacterium]
MFSKEVRVTNQVGLYAKAATTFVQKANEFKSTIWVEKEERRVNAKSLLGILSMGLTKDSVMTVLAEGKDEQEAVMALVELAGDDSAD